MLFYNGSKLESDLDDLKKEIKKTDYEKAIEPYQKRIDELERKLYYQNKDMNTLYFASKELINSINEDYLEVIINLDKPKVYFGTPEVAKGTFKKIVVPIQQDLLENYVHWFNYYKSKYKLGDDK